MRITLVSLLLAIAHIKASILAEPSGYSWAAEKVMVPGKLARVAAFKSVAPVAPSPPGKTTRNRVPSSSKVAVVFRGGEGADRATR